MDVRDLVRGLWLSSECCETGEVYNLGGYQIYSVEELIEAIRSHLKVGFSIQQDPALMRACDEPVIAGDTTKFRACSGWEPQIELGKRCATCSIGGGRAWSRQVPPRRCCQGLGLGGCFINGSGQTNGGYRDRQQSSRGY